MYFRHILAKIQPKNLITTFRLEREGLVTPLLAVESNQRLRPSESPSETKFWFWETLSPRFLKNRNFQNGIQMYGIIICSNQCPIVHYYATAIFETNFIFKISIQL